MTNATINSSTINVHAIAGGQYRINATRRDGQYIACFDVDGEWEMRQKVEKLKEAFRWYGPVRVDGVLPLAGAIISF